MNAAAVARYVGTQIKMRRRVAGLTRSQLAHASGVPINVVKLMEAGQIALSWSDLARVARALGCEVDMLFEGDAGDAAPFPSLH